MSVRTNSKEILAKLMAAENLFVEHANVSTAAFDLINRKLFLPNWKDISDSVYTLLISHEVGHALFTPREEWEKAVMDKSANKNLKSVINIVEDVRIEKCIQQKYPGTIRAFKAGYNELEKANLFGTVGKKIEDYSLLDRLNIHFKVGHFGYVNVPFLDQEKIWLNKIQNCKTFSDVVSVATDLLQYVKDNPESQGEQSQHTEDSPDGNESSDDSGNLQPSEGSESGETPTKISIQPASNDGENEQSGNTLQISDFNDDPFDVKTQKHFDKSIQNLVDNTISSVTYANIPNVDVSKYIVPHTKVHEQISAYYNRYYPNIIHECEQKVSGFKNSSKNVVNQLANLFEMKKKARLDERALTSRTGVLDTNRVYSYRYSDDLFKKITTIPVGKSHGLVMFIDMSSSMANNIAGTFDQLLNLVLFCRRVNIPFQVYGFTDAYSSRDGLATPPTPSPGELIFEDNFCLREFFTNRMTGTEFNIALRNILCLMRSYSGEGRHVGVPTQCVLNCTPLNSTIITAINIVNQFRSNNSLDIVNTIFLTDGDDTYGLVHIDPVTKERAVINRNRRFSYNYFPNEKKTRCFLRDVRSRKQWEVGEATKDLLEIFKDMTDSKVIGFFLTGKSDAEIRINHSQSDYLKREALIDSFKKLKFAELLKFDGYDAYYLIPHGKNLKTVDGEFDKDFDTSVDWDDQKQVKKAIRSVQKDFTNHMKDRLVSRVLLNKFIDHIC